MAHQRVAGVYKLISRHLQHLELARSRRVVVAKEMPTLQLQLISVVTCDSL